MCRPQFVDHHSSFLQCDDLRHPLLTLASSCEFVVPNSICIGHPPDVVDADVVLKYPPAPPLPFSSTTSSSSTPPSSHPHLHATASSAEQHYQAHHNIMLLTGPNMGGKSTFLRQTCIAVILAQLGCYVPATRCVLAPFDRIFTRCGASDNIAAGQVNFQINIYI